MTSRTADGSQDEALLIAIGSVMRSSANLSHMFQQFAATITGSQLVVFAFDDKTLMPQRDLLEKLVMATNWNKYAEHPEVDELDRVTTLDILTECRQLIEYRNRIAHDDWNAWPSEEVPDRLEGHRPSRWSRGHVVTSIQSLKIVASQIFNAAAALSTMEERITLHRRAEEGRRTIGGSAPERFLRECANRRAGTTDGFGWEDIKWDGRPQRSNVRLTDLD